MRRDAMRRREFITLLGGAAAAWPRPARTQQPAIPVIGYLSSRLREEDAPYLTAVRQGLSETGYLEGKNLSIEYRWAEGHYDRLPGLAFDLVRRQVNVIASSGGVPGARAAKAATTTIPIVFVTGTDPVAFGLVASLNRPGGNLTGITTLSDEVAPKRLELLHELLPSVTSFGLLVNPANPNAGPQVKEMQAAARTRGLALHVLHASAEGDLDGVFAAVTQLRLDGIVIGPDTLFTTPSQTQRLAALSVRHRVPAIFFTREFAAAGGLMSYGSVRSEGYRQVGIYAGRILKGEKPADLPVQQVTKIELIINLKTAKALGLTVPLSLRGRADEVIE
jgi:putative tryptophan/tyrosine transport system substrate-binding protein